MTQSAHVHDDQLTYTPWIAAVLVSLAAALAVVLPIFLLGNASGHDIQFHASSWMDIAGQWKQGILFPRWSEWANYGYGEPRFIFYPPLSWLLGAALGLAIPWHHVASIFILLVQTFAGFSAYALVRRFVPHRPALLGAALYAANPNSLMIVYLRSDYAELLAIALFPLLLLTCLRVCGWFPAPYRRISRELVYFALPLAAIWLADAPAGVIASYGVALLFIWAGINQKSWLPVARGAAGLLLGCGLSAFYLIPAAYEERWVNIGQALSGGLRPADNFLFARTHDPDHDAFNRIASYVALLLIALTLCAVLAAWRYLRNSARDSAPGNQTKAWHALLALAAVSVLMMLPITRPLWSVAPELRFVQFPWRWMSMLAAVCSVFFAAALVDRRRSWFWAILIFFLLGGTGTYLGRSGWWDQGDFDEVQQAITQGQGFEGTDEYDPRGDNHADLPQNQPPARLIPEGSSSQAPADATLQVELWTAENRIILVNTPEPVHLAVRLLNYPAWRVTVNGIRVSPGNELGLAAMDLDLSAGTSRVEIRFTRTLDRTIGGYISVSALLAALLLAFYPMKK
jgi:6-pyruvoyl-tetrahydropterin synthase related domain